MTQLQHNPVMLGPAIDGLAVHTDGRYLDGTFGRGGHSAAILERLGTDGQLLAIDRDPEAVAVARKRMAGDERFSITHGNFSDLASVAASASLDGILLDLGVSSPQLDDASRGFSFMRDGPLDMRMDPSSGVPASQFVNTAEPRDIAWVLKRYGEEKRASAIARAIAAQREDQPFTRTSELAELIEKTLGRRQPGKHPATRSFQALRIYINDELGALEAALQAAAECLKPGGRLVIISFHSLEDRVVKRALRGDISSQRHSRRLPPAVSEQRVFRPLGKPVRGDDREIQLNPRARSAILRVGERVAA